MKRILCCLFGVVSSALGAQQLITTSTTLPQSIPIINGNFAELYTNYVNASNLTAGTIPTARMAASLQAIVNNTGALNLAGVTLTLPSTFATDAEVAAAVAAVPSIPSQTGHSGHFLTTNGTVLSWVAGGGGGLASTDIDTSAELKAILGDELGDASGKVIFSLGTLAIASTKTFTASNTLTLSGTDGSTLAIGTGGTLGTAAYTASSAYDVSGAAAAVLPTQTGHNGHYLTSNGTVASWAAVAGSGDALVANPLSQFAATTSAQLKGVLSDELGDSSGKVIFALGTLAIASGKTLTSSNTLTLAGTDGSTLTIGTGGTLGTAAYTATTAYEVPITFSTGLTRTTNTITVNSTQSIAKLSNLTTNGFVKTGSGDGTLSVDTATYRTTASMTGLPVEFCIAASDETTAITTGAAKVTFRAPFAFTVTAVRSSLTTVSSSGLPTVDINESGTTILSTKLTIDASEKTSTTAATAAVISDTAIADDAEITIDIDTAGTGAAGLKVWILGTR